MLGLARSPPFGICKRAGRNVPLSGSRARSHIANSEDRRGVAVQASPALLTFVTDHLRRVLPYQDSVGALLAAPVPAPHRLNQRHRLGGFNVAPRSSARHLVSAAVFRSGPGTALRVAALYPECLSENHPRHIRWLCGSRLQPRHKKRLRRIFLSADFSPSLSLLAPDAPAKATGGALLSRFSIRRGTSLCAACF